MSAKPLSREEAIRTVDAWVKSSFSRSTAAELLGIATPTFDNRLRAAQRFGIVETTDATMAPGDTKAYPVRIGLSVEDGEVVIGSDCHYWPGLVSPAHKAFLKVIDLIKPKVVILNGDVMDGASVSRHDPIGWEDRPLLADEIEACRDRLMEIEDVAGKAQKIWSLGNHDSRMESKLAAVAPQYAKMHGVKIKDHFPRWQHCWSSWINNDVVVKHRQRGGVHAAYTNTLHAGKTIVTGHLHSLKVTPFTDYDSTRFGVDSGCIAEAFPREQAAKQFGYLEDNPVNWRSGFVVLTFRKGRLLWPDLCHVWSRHDFDFRGKCYRI